MSRECPRCRLKFHRGDDLRMVWCPTDRCYYCAQCYREGCKPVHGDKPLVRMQGRMVAFVAYLFLGLGFLPLGLVAYLMPAPSATQADSVAGGLAILAAIGVGAAWFAITALVRTARHRAAVLGVGEASPDSFDDARDSSLPWRTNQPVPPRRKRRLVLMAVGFLVSATIVLLVDWASGLALPVFPFMALVGFLLALSGVSAFSALLPVSVPSAIAVAPDGVHFWYDSVYDRRTQTPLMTWTELNILGMRSGSISDPAKTLVRMFRIDPDNAAVIYDAWRGRRVGPRPTGASVRAAKPLPAALPLPPVDVPATAVLASRAGVQSGTRRGTACARCQGRFPGVEGLRLLWCKVDRVYVCRRCWEEQCGEGHGRGLKAVSKPARLAAAVIVAVVFLAIWWPGVAYDSAVRNTWDSAIVSPISTLQVGQTVKVDGTIASSSPIAFGGYEVVTRSGWYWEWDTNDLFTLSDLSGSILVSTAEWYIVYNGPIPAPNAYHVQAGVYGAGDFVQIVGQVVQGPNGALELEAQVVAMELFAPYITIPPSIWTSSLLVVLPSLGIAALAGGAGVFLRRRSLHRNATRGQPSYSVRDSAEVRDPKLDWKPNGRGTDPRRRGRWSIGIIAAGVGLLVVYPGFAPRGGFGMFILGFVGTLVLVFVAVPVYLLLFGGVGHPSYVAVADDGFRMWFESPYDRHLNDTIFPWDQIKNIHLTGGKNAHWVLNWTTGENTNLYMLTGGNLRLLMEEWSARGVPAGS